MKLRNIINSATFKAVLPAILLGFNFAFEAYAQAPKPIEKISAVKKATSASAKTKNTAKVKTKAKRDIYGPFVPPPPPNIPTFSSAGDMENIDLVLSGLSFMTETDLKSRLSSNELRLKNERSKLKDQSTNVEEKKKRAQSFVELFEQGIVSKKELEGSSRESEQAVADLEETRVKVKDLEINVNTLKNRLSAMQKRKAISKANSKLVDFSENRKQNRSKPRPQSKRKNESKSLPAETASDKSKN